MTQETRHLLAHPLFVALVAGVLAATMSAIGIAMTVKADVSAVQKQVELQQTDLTEIKRDVKFLILRLPNGTSPTNGAAHP